MNNSFTSFCTKGYPRLWVARIVGEDEAYGFKREWVDVQAKTQDKSIIFFVENLADGLYQYGNQIAVKHSHDQEKGYLLVQNSEIQKITTEEVPAAFQKVFGHDCAFTPRDFKASTKIPQQKETHEIQDSPASDFDPNDFMPSSFE